jgi:hypothetical protein
LFGLHQGSPPLKLQRLEFDVELLMENVEEVELKKG